MSDSGRNLAVDPNLRNTFLAPTAYAPAPTGITVTDTANILAAVNKLDPSLGGTVVLRNGIYRATLPLKSNVLYRGQGKQATEIRCSSGSMIDLTAATGSLQGVSFESLTLSTEAGHLIALGTGGGGLANGHFHDVSLIVYTTASSVINGGGSCVFLGYTFKDTSLSRQTGHSVPAIDLTSSAGGLNANVFDTVTLYGSKTTLAPAIRIEGTANAYVYDNAFRNIVGEQNCGGLIHIYSPCGLIMDGVAEWDGGIVYADHIVKIDKGGTSHNPRDLFVRNVGTRYQTMAAGKQHVYVSGGINGQFSIQGVGDPNGTTLVTAPSPSMTITANYTLVAADLDNVIGNGAAVTLTLPDPTVTRLDRRIGVKNVAATALTVNSAGAAKTIDGAASQSLAQWGKATYVTDGTQWLSV